MRELITSLAVQHVHFLDAYRSVKLFYNISVTQFAVYWNHALTL